MSKAADLAEIAREYEEAKAIITEALNDWCMSDMSCTTKKLAVAILTRLANGGFTLEKAKAPPK